MLEPAKGCLLPRCPYMVPKGPQEFKAPKVPACFCVVTRELSLPQAASPLYASAFTSGWLWVGERVLWREAISFMSLKLKLSTAQLAQEKWVAQFSCWVGLSRLLANRMQYPPQYLISSNYKAGPESTLLKVPQADTLSSGIIYLAYVPSRTWRFMESIWLQQEQEMGRAGFWSSRVPVCIKGG